MSGDISRTPPGTQVRLEIPRATIVAHGDLQMRVTFPGRPNDVIVLPLVDGRYEPTVYVHPCAPQVHAGQTWRAVEHGLLFFAVRWRADESDVGTDWLIAAQGGAWYSPEQAVEDFGQLALVAEYPPYDFTPPAVDPPAADPSPTGTARDVAGPADLTTTAVIPRMPAAEARPA
ncbi:hypothetical protein E1091_15745 [Micromonospora fluostatini]|uniref:DUF427 domain-containing protein n=1 Tax=Micromonospora fluostatini TaxID=1629071 RepID=A0ABY2DED5_9ACTN|nr:hypothetical protein E1091_15745 [Micromonospora fluostatini]